jgi:hypothetical protein
VSKASLATYFQDHVAGAAAAVEILEALRDEHTGEALGQFADVLMEVEADRAHLETIGCAGGRRQCPERNDWLGLARTSPGSS